MKNKIFLFLLLFVPLTMLAAMTQSQKSSMIKKADTEFRAGNYDEAYNLYMEIYMEGGREKKYNDLKILCEKLSELMSDANKAIEKGHEDDALTCYEQMRELLRKSKQDTYVADRLIAEANGDPIPSPPSSNQSNSPGKSSKSKNVINGHEYVDLGLSVKWATCNVGASKPSHYGNYYAWGETKTKSTYDDDNSLTFDKSMNDIGGTQYDVAHTDWGAPWRMPTRAEFQELIDKCKWQWTKVDGHKGCKVTGPNGNSIFLAAAGERDGGSAYGVRLYGNYWSSSPDSLDAGACLFGFDDEKQDFYWGIRYRGMTIRPVLE